MIRLNCEGCGRFVWLENSNVSILRAVADTEDGDVILCRRCNHSGYVTLLRLWDVGDGKEITSMRNMDNGEEKSR